MLVRSISQRNSLGPFFISEKSLRNLLFTYQVPLLFVDILLGVNGEGLVSEEAYGNTFYEKRTSGSASTLLGK